MSDSEYYIRINAYECDHFTFNESGIIEHEDGRVYHVDGCMACAEEKIEKDEVDKISKEIDLK